MELLNYKTNPPKGDRHGNYYYQDWIFVYFDTKENRRNQFFMNDDARCCTLSEIAEWYKIIKEMRFKKRRSNKNTTVIWCNKLSAAIWFWKQFGEWEEKWYEAKQAREKSLWSLRNDWCEIRNFDLICNTDDLEKLKKSYEFESNSEVGTMRAFFKMREEQGLKGWVEINYSFAHCELKSFYSQIDKSAAPQDHYSMIPNLSVYQELQKGIKHGVLINHEGLERLWWKNCVESWDLSSAYPSKFVNMKMPMGKFERVENIHAGTLKELMTSDKYFYARVNFNHQLREEDCPIFNGMDGEERDGRWFYTLTNFDLEAMKLTGFDLGAADARFTIIRVAEYKDYIWKPIRELIYKRWVEKQESKKTNYSKYFRAKTAIDAIWGKSIQEFNPTSNKQIANRFTKIQHFILPQWGLWCCAAVRLEMIKAIIKLGKNEFLAGDTDGIKTLGDQSLIFNELNEKIRMDNAAAGFPSDIGTWHFEGKFDNYIFIKSKFYAYSQEDKLTCKFAGCNTWEEFFKDFTIEKVFEYLEENDIKCYNTGVVIMPKGMYKAKLRREGNEWILDS